MYRSDNTRSTVPRAASRINYKKAGVQIEKKSSADETSLKLTLCDHLTGLPNRTVFFERLGKVLSAARDSGATVYVLFLDIDVFKNVNNAMGYDAGDEVLKQAGARITGAIGRNDVAARIGGDEFLIMLTGVANEGEMLTVMNGIHKKIGTPFTVSGTDVKISCSIGIAKYPSDGSDAETLVSAADMAMNKAKEDGKNRFAFYSYQIKKAMQSEMEMISSMQAALNKDEFMLYYQPQFDSRSKDIVGMEALIRWNHPTLGVLLPEDFFPVAEKSGLCVDIGEWVLRTACRQNKLWQDAGIVKAPVAVNLSNNQVINKALLRQLTAILRETGLDPSYLTLELTERIIAKRKKEAQMEMECIKGLGVRIAIDDFGSGSSSISNLKNFPVDIIKIPMEFTHGIEKNPKDEAFISLILNLASNLELEVIAQGVETKNQLSFLSNHLCHLIQGYYFCGPMQAKDIKLYCKVSSYKAAYEDLVPEFITTY